MTSTVSNQSHRTVYSKYGPKMRAIDTTASSHATPSNAWMRNSDVGAAGSGGPYGRPPQHDQADEPDDGDDAERVAAWSEHPWPEQVELDDDDLGTSPRPRYGPSGWRKLSIRIDTLPGDRRS